MAMCQLTRLQEELIYAAEVINLHYFVDLGGVTYYDINFTSKKGFPLKVAAIKGSVKFIRLILENKMLDLQKKDEDGLNAFWIAARYGHGDVMKVLAEKGIDIMNTDRHGLNVLHVASKYRYPNVTHMLVKSGFPLNLKTNALDTALHIAAQKGNLGSVQTLVKEGAKLDCLNQHSFCALYLAMINIPREHEKDNPNLLCAEYLLEMGASSFIDGSDL